MPGKPFIRFVPLDGLLTFEALIVKNAKGRYGFGTLSIELVGCDCFGSGLFTGLVSFLAVDFLLTIQLACVIIVNTSSFLKFEALEFYFAKIKTGTESSI